jgi:hypothetical protein
MQPVANDWKLLYPIGSNPAWINPIRPRYPVEYLLTFRHRVFRPASPHRLAIEEPCWPARAAIARYVEQFGGCPDELGGEASPVIEKLVGGIDSLQPVRHGSNE